jgi:hypothetical protein
MVEITSGFGFEIVGNRGRAVVLDGAGELVDLTVEIHQIGERRRGEDGSERGTREETAGDERLGQMQSYSFSLRR